MCIGKTPLKFSVCAKRALKICLHRKSLCIPSKPCFGENLSFKRLHLDEIYPLGKNSS